MEEKKETPTAPVSTKPKRSREGREGREGRAQRGSGGAPAAAPAPLTHCDVCTQPGDATNLVRCDECHKRYHFTCLEPPLNKNPKKRGYSWHCADCDPTVSEYITFYDNINKATKTQPPQACAN